MERQKTGKKKRKATSFAANVRKTAFGSEEEEEKRESTTAVSLLLSKIGERKKKVRQMQNSGRCFSTASVPTNCQKENKGKKKRK